MKNKLTKDLETIKKAIEQGVAQLNALYGQEAYITNFLKELDNEEKKEESLLFVLILEQIVSSFYHSHCKVDKVIVSLPYGGLVWVPKAPL